MGSNHCACKVFYLHQLNKKGEPKIDSNGFHLYYSIRGTNLTELFHKSLVSTYRTWQVGIEYSDYLLMECNHRNNYRMSLKKRINFPNIEDYDIRLIDALQILYQ